MAEPVGRNPGEYVLYYSRVSDHLGSDLPGSTCLADVLSKLLPAARLEPYLGLVGQDPDKAAALYVWNRDLSAAIFADLALLEVVLRNAMHRAATAQWGPDWLLSPEIALDYRTEKQLSEAWGRLPEAIKQAGLTDDVPGRLVAQCMFGFWANLLDKGGHTGRAPRKRSADYEMLWNAAFKTAFPGGRSEAKALRQASGKSTPTFERDWMHGVCKRVNELRNRVAHHESLINGFPLKGQFDSAGVQVRLTARQGFEENMLVLARSLDRDFGRWLAENSQVPGLLDARPPM